MGLSGPIMGIPNFALKHTKCLAYKVSSTTPQVDKSDEPADKRSQQDCHIAVHFTFFVGQNLPYI